MPKFQLCTSSGFGIINELITFQAKYSHFLKFFFGGVSIPRISRVPIPRDLGSPKLVHMRLIFILMLSPNFNFQRFTVCKSCLLVIILEDEDLPHLPKFAKNNGTTRSRDLPIAIPISHEYLIILVHFK